MSDLIRHQMEHFETRTINQAINVIKFAFGSVIKKEKDLKYGYIDIRVINRNG